MPIHYFFAVIPIPPLLFLIHQTSPQMLVLRFLYLFLLLFHSQFPSLLLSLFPSMHFLWPHHPLSFKTQSNNIIYELHMSTIVDSATCIHQILLILDLLSLCTIENDMNKPFCESMLTVYSKYMLLIL